MFYGCVSSWLWSWIPSNRLELSPSLRKESEIPRREQSMENMLPASSHRLATIAMLMLCSSKAGGLWISAWKASLAHKLRYSRRGFSRLYSRDFDFIWSAIFLQFPVAVTRQLQLVKKYSARAAFIHSIAPFPNCSWTYTRNGRTLQEMKRTKP